MGFVKPSVEAASKIQAASPVSTARSCALAKANPDPQKDGKIRSPRTRGELYKAYIGVIMGLYRGSNF